MPLCYQPIKQQKCFSTHSVITWKPFTCFHHPINFIALLFTRQLNDQIIPPGFFFLTIKSNFFSISQTGKRLLQSRVDISSPTTLQLTNQCKYGSLDMAENTAPSFFIFVTAMQKTYRSNESNPGF